MLIPFHTNTVWVDRRFGPFFGIAAWPYNTVERAHDAAREGGRVVFFGQSHPEKITLRKELLYETIGSTAVIGEQ